MIWGSFFFLGEIIIPNPYLCIYDKANLINPFGHPEFCSCTDK